MGDDGHGVDSDTGRHLHHITSIHISTYLQYLSDIYNIHLDQDLCEPLCLGPLWLVAALAPLDVQHEGAQPLRHLQPGVR